MAKRGQRKQITQGDPDPVDDDDDEEMGQAGTFARADESVIKNRRIVTARRRGGGGGGGGGLAASEPPPQQEEAAPAVQWDMGAFTAASGFGPTEPAAAPAWGGGEFSFPTSASPMTFGGGPASAFSFGATEGDAQQSGGGVGGGFAFGGGTGTEGGFGDAGAAGGAFGFNFGGGGGEQAKEDDSGGENNNPEEEVGGFAPHAGAPAVEVQEVAVSTGEEGERQAFPGTRSKLYQFAEGRWMERGTGKVSVNVLTADESKARVLFRAEQVGTIRLNVAVFPDMNPEISAEKSVKFLGVVDGKPATFCVRFGKPTEAQSLLAELKTQMSKGGGGGAAEASPKKARSEAPTPQQVVEPAVSRGPAAAKKTGGSVGPKTVPPKAPVVAAPAAEDASVAVCVLEQQSVAGVVTLSRGSGGVLLEATLEGLTPGRSYALELDGASLARLSPAAPGARVSVAARLSSDSPIASYAGKRLSLSDGGATRITAPIKLDL